MKRSRIHRLVRSWPLFALLSLQACGPALPGLFQRTSPHARYAAGLRDAGLDSTALGQAWAEASRHALAEAVVVATPFAETIHFPDDRAVALGYHLRPERGAEMHIEVEALDSAYAQVFVDVFERRAGEEGLRALASADGTLALSWVAGKERSYFVRVQPELLRSTRLTIRIRSGASIAFPVEGRTSDHIRSFFGNPRDGGRRRHEGVDVFAPRGTPVLAVVDGWANASINTLGGKVVWLRGGGYSYYYAHLDSQYVGGMRPVRAGDTLGTVGTTGNAVHTPPHLHFGIYASGEGAVDPLPFVRTTDASALDIVADTALLGIPLRVVVSTALLRTAPAADAPILLRMPEGKALRPYAASGDRYRVRADGQSGYVAASLVRPVTDAMRTEVLPSGSTVHDQPHTDAPVMLVLAESSHVDVLATEGPFLLVRVGEVVGWVRA
jgi:murein DD-endopeptidase MepM/ murein hydrolase activator NlpD